MKKLLSAIGVCWAMASIACAATLAATPANVGTVVRSAAVGDVISLSAGDYGPQTFVGLKGLTFNTIGAKLTRWEFKDSDGLRFNDGEWLNACVATPCYNNALTFRNSRNIEVNRPVLSGPASFADGYGIQTFSGENVLIRQHRAYRFKMAVGFTKSKGVKVENGYCEDNRSDCVNLAQINGGTVDGLICVGTQITSGEHPDCVQSWSRPDWPPTSNLVIRNVLATGGSQVIGLFNHTRLYPAGYTLADGSKLEVATNLDDGGFDNVRIENVVGFTSFPQGIAVVHARGLELVNNRVSTMPTSEYRTSINVTAGTVKLRCGNVVAPGDGKPGIIDPPCQDASAAEVDRLRAQMAAARAALQ